MSKGKLEFMDWKRFWRILRWFVLAGMIFLLAIAVLFTIGGTVLEIDFSSPPFTP